MARYIIQVKKSEGVEWCNSTAYDRKGIAATYVEHPFKSENEAVEYYLTELKPYHETLERKKLRYFVNEVMLQKLDEKSRLYKDFKVIYSNPKPFEKERILITYQTSEPIITDNKELLELCHQNHCVITGGMRKDSSHWTAFVDGIKDDIEDLITFIMNHKIGFSIERKGE